MSSQPNVLQTRSRTRALQENATSIRENNDEELNKSYEGPHIPTEIDKEGGELNGEKYMVQCQDLSNGRYHFSCANVKATTVRMTGFVCVVCLPSGVTGSTEPTPRVISE